MRRFLIALAALIATPAAAQLSNPVPNPAEVTQATTTVTAPDGSYDATWAQPFPQAPRAVAATIPSLTDPYVCQTTVMTATRAAGRCWRLTPSTLSGTLTSLPGTLISPFVNAAGGLSVTVLGTR